MNLYKDIVFPVLKKTDPESAHHRAATWLRLAQSTGPGRFFLRQIAGTLPDRPVLTLGLRFPNVLGIAAGFDKDVQIARGLGLLGFGHVETGTLTPRPQPGNPRPRIFRLPADRALVNRMGFPNAGIEGALPRLRRLSALAERPIIGVSLGKQKDTPLEKAALDYQAIMRAVYVYTDYLAVNISSPNTPGLRELQGTQFLETLCRTLVQESSALARERNARRRPVLVKIAPDVSRRELGEMLAVIRHTGIDGIIATNTTIKRPKLRDPRRREKGGLSGAPLARLGTRLIDHIARQTGGDLPIIGAGGIFTARDARQKLDAGATLLQVYTGLVYEGPAMAGRILRGIGQHGNSPFH